MGGATLGRNVRAWHRVVVAVLVGLLAAADATLAHGPALAQEGGAEQGGASPEASRTTRRPRRRARGGSRVDRVIVHEGRAMQRFGRGPEGSAAYAQALDTIRTAVGDRATLYSIIVPTAQEFYSPEPPPPGRTAERPNILATYALLHPDIRRVDAHAVLAQHTEENLYFRTDVHWTGLAGYYAYRAFCEAAGLEPVPLEGLERRVVNPSWIGSLQRTTGDTTLVPDVVEILIPPVEVELTAWERSGEHHSAPLFRPRATGYVVFLGGDRPIMRGRSSTHSGRRVILVKNSYGNAFAVHLVSHYEEVVFIDYRSFRGSLLDVLAESELPTDLLFMNGSLTSNSTEHCHMIQSLLQRRD